ncbi:MAG: ADP-ribosyltransferase domain-containing protein [Actinomycetota bacterium]
MSDLVVAETAAVQALQRGVAAYAAALQTLSSTIGQEMRRVEGATRDAVDQHRRRLRQAEIELERALEALRRASDEGRAACAAALRTAQASVAAARQRLENAQRAERHVAVALHELGRVVSVAEGAVADQSSAAAAALLELEERLSAITGARRLTTADRGALSDITGMGHQSLNRTLSAGSIAEVSAVAARTNAVSHALAKLPVHEGTVLRGSAGNLTEAQIAQYEPGDIRVEDRFVHASVDPEVADGRFHGNVVWAIDSKKGRRVESHSEVPSEREVMFDKFTRFEVLAKDRIEGTGQWLIYMREL